MVDCDRPCSNDNASKQEGNCNVTEQSANTEMIEEKMRLSRPIAYLGPGFVPLPKLCVSVACGTDHTRLYFKGSRVGLGKEQFGQLGFLQQNQTQENS